jgi:hypothetical protein
MKNTSTVRVIAATALCMLCVCLLILSCKKDTALVYNGTILEKCKNVVCYNGGTCKDGFCVCPVGYDGLDCKTTWNSRYIGTYEAYDECSPSAGYTTNIVALVNDASGITINNLGSICAAQSLSAKITKEKTNIEIPLQQACANWWMSGTGTQTANGDYINIFLTAKDTLNGEVKTCSVVLRKK